MKTTTMIITIAVGLAVQAMAAGSNNNTPSASTDIHKNTVQQRAYPFLEPKVKHTDSIERFGGISSRPWAQTAAWTGASNFVDEKNHEAHFNLFWLGATPN